MQTKVTIPEGFRVSQIIRCWARRPGTSRGTSRPSRIPAALGLPAFAGGKPEGYLFPATYDIQPNTTPAAVLKTMVTQFKQNAQGIGLAAAAAAAQETQAAVITVASLIEAEGKRPQDFPKIAEVIYNRLNATADEAAAGHDRPVRDGAGPQERASAPSFPSPYNTYVHAGLPPGPIDNPGNAAIQAALHPAHGNFLYFLTINSKTGQDPVLHHRRGVRQRGGQVRQHRRRHGLAHGLGLSATIMKAAVLGSPIAHSLSPVLHRAGYQALGLAGWTYEAIECDEAGLPGLIGRCGPDWAGLSLTMPLKRAVLPLLDEAEPLVADVGAANTVIFDAAPAPRAQHRRPGHDRRAGREPAGRGMTGRIRGGLARGDPLPHPGRRARRPAPRWPRCAALGITQATVAVRDPRRAATCRPPRTGSASSVRLAAFDGPAVPAPGVLIATAPAGAADTSPNGSRRCARPRCVLDVVYHPWPTRLAVAAERSGAAVAGGFALLLHQAARQFELMTGKPAPLEAMRAAGLAALPAPPVVSAGARRRAAEPGPVGPAGQAEPGGASCARNTQRA